MTDWAAFAGIVGVVLGLLLLLARVSQSALQLNTSGGSDDSASQVADSRSTDDPDASRPDDPDASRPADREEPRHAGDTGRRGEALHDTTTPGRNPLLEPSGGEDSGSATAPGPGGTHGDEPGAGGDRDPWGDDVGEVATADRLHDTQSDDPQSTTPADEGFGPAPRSATDDRGLTELHWTERMHASQPDLSTAGLLANVAVSQGAFALLLLAGAWVAAVPPAAFGVTPGGTTLRALGLGVGLGVGLYVANEVGAAASDRLGLARSEELRALLAPESRAGWAALLLVVLPVIAGFEELLFRGALVGALSVGFGLSPWLLAAVSSVVFAVGHGAQGPTGILVTGVLGFVLAAAFVLTGSLLVVVVAHYLVNALEFVVHEGFGVEWFEPVG